MDSKEFHVWFERSQKNRKKDKFLKIKKILSISVGLGLVGLALMGISFSFVIGADKHKKAWTNDLIEQYKEGFEKFKTQQIEEGAILDPENGFSSEAYGTKLEKSNNSLFEEYFSTVAPEEARVQYHWQTNTDNALHISASALGWTGVASGVAGMVGIAVQDILTKKMNKESCETNLEI